MKAMTLKQPGGLNHIRLSEEAVETSPGRGEIRVRIQASSLNYHDLLVAEGALPTEDDRILLSDGAGVVEAVGEGVTEFSVGDSVVSVFFPQWQSGPAGASVSDFAQTPGDGVDGMAAEVVTRSANAFTHAPEGWTPEQSATITTAGVTAWRALVSDGQLQAGDTIVTLGTGGVSIAALQIARMSGARVIATSSSDDKLARLRSLGADEVINYRQTPDWGQKVLELTQGRGARQIIEVGGPGTLEQSIQAVAPGGQISLIGVLTGFEGTVPTAAMMFKQVRLQGLLVGSRKHQMEYVKALEANDRRPVIDKVFPFSDLAGAFAYQKSGAHFGKVCVSW
ncbi:zinc-dependent alcohol dehydrogenase family protein [Marinobacter sp. F3R08]|uniref:zinc-dependent alcohol dehydrogenase family protein n=1 Tax=Marinobacter sp. F3R08 TaxID=2841559 RepID=UPI001C0A5698|nr:NAD(P)-dependent alcohol dehydrogenase [Marinobacter sp. F3R08]MBU2953709.1 NAD(P)-dependent alcohol dehydrogenase [Marinobacter sp. F3R08]